MVTLVTVIKGEGGGSDKGTGEGGNIGDSDR